jgi:hypothetical protein
MELEEETIRHKIGDSRIQMIKSPNIQWAHSSFGALEFLRILIYLAAACFGILYSNFELTYGYWRLCANEEA